MCISLPFFFQCFVLFKKCCERETPSNYFVKLYLTVHTQTLQMEPWKKITPYPIGRMRCLFEENYEYIEHQVWHNLVIRSIFGYLF